MELLQQRIANEAVILPGDIVRIDGFLNHLVDIKLMQQLAREFRRLFPSGDIDKILTVEASGIALAAITAQEFGLPLLFAKKAKSDNIDGTLFRSDIYSYTYKKNVTLTVAADWLHRGEKVLIIDDFLARGQALHGLCDIVHQAGAVIAGIGIAVEKGFQSGGMLLRESGAPLISLAIIDEIHNGKLIFREQLPIIEVNEANLADAARVYSRSWHSSHASFCSPEFLRTQTLKHHTDYLSEKLAGGAQLFMLLDHTIPAAVVSCNNNLIEDLYVLPEMQNRGYGTRLLKHALTLCTGNALLWVLDNNTRAAALYERNGFVFTGKRVQLTGTLSEFEMQYRKEQN